MVPTANASGKVALLGGSFNPPHCGHLRLCEAILAMPGIAGVWLVPVAVHPGRKPLAPFADRLHMCRLMAARVAGPVTVCDLEGRLEPPVKTRDLVRALVALHPETPFVLAMGADVAAHAPRWPGWLDIVQAAPPLIFPRFEPDFEPGFEPAVWASTEARRRLAAGEPASGLLLPEIEDYATARRLYGPETHAEA
ncbi:nicotinate-nicotinamide nucleotide adenylyltransferase [Azospirillum sp.]|uniref:nicotinate-nicotinamide nucleotide adenylyltransferase n=1 Tax=Azospirillum sp. TaxID=34012 RepID=UPI002D6F120D|nr:nicotinate-nicotinamide nucleotide adenylyltransferase [Azospirillum sp.]HYD68825.1 nicotinate-nicotinamide nucleotide adenylyltransferase [Azospirillum sp.]